MTDIISVSAVDFGGEEVQAVSAYALYEFLELRSDHFARWRDGVKREGQPGSDYILSNAMDGESSDLILSLDFAKTIAMMSKSKKGKEVRLYFITLEKAYKRVTTAKIPQNFSQALLLASKQAEEIEKLEEMRAIEAPLVEFAKTVQSVENEITVEEFAKVTFPKFSLGRNLMFAKLRELGFLKGDNIPYQQYITQGLFRTIDVVKANRVYVQTLITGKGQVLLEGEITI